MQAIKIFQSKIIQLIVICLLILAFWFPICFNNSFFADDWEHIDTYKNKGVSSSYFSKPNNEHFMPLFKLSFFAMYKLFDLNIAPYMLLSIFLHIINSILLFCLLELIFYKKSFLSFFLVLFFALNTTYFEILHWFTNFSQALTFFFLLLTLFALHYYIKKGRIFLYWGAVVASFFIPMNFSMGFLSIIFIPLYYFLVVKKRFFKDEAKKDLLFLMPFFAVWLLYLFVYLIFALPFILNRAATGPATTFNVGIVSTYILLGFIGFFVKNVGFSMLVFPYTTGLAILLTFLFVFFLMFFMFYIVLNGARKRTPLFKDSISMYALLCMFFCYFVLAFGRASLGVEAFLSWGRYHYLPMFFFVIFLGAIFPQAMEIFSKIFNRNRVKLFLMFLLLIFLINQFILIRQKSEASIRTEGFLPSGVTIALASNYPQISLII